MSGINFCVGIGMLLGATAIVLNQVHKAKVRKAEDMVDNSSMDETAEIKIPNDPEDKGDGQK